MYPWILRWTLEPANDLNPGIYIRCFQALHLLPPENADAITLDQIGRERCVSPKLLLPLPPLKHQLH
jgi:hypothetical protein